LKKENSSEVLSEMVSIQKAIDQYNQTMKLLYLRILTDELDTDDDDERIQRIT
jgi:hypothetical protein